MSIYIRFPVISTPKEKITEDLGGKLTLGDHYIQFEVEIWSETEDESTGIKKEGYFKRIKRHWKENVVGVDMYKLKDMEAWDVIVLLSGSCEDISIVVEKEKRAKEIIDTITDWIFRQ